MERQHVFMDITINDQPEGRLVFELYNDITPKTAENFRMLCTGEKGIGRSGKPLHYKGCPFHRIISQFMAQGGDFVQMDGTGGESIYGKRFEDENFEMKHSKAGILSMANAGPGTNASQFFVTFVPCSWLDGKHVVFGELIEGMDTLKKIEACGSRSGATSKSVIIADCGEFKSEEETEKEKE